MKDDAIFLLKGDSDIQRVPLQPYSNEDMLQQLIARYPALLAGEQIDPDDPPRWLLIKREAGIPDDDGASDRWAADHLLLDHNACPTIVEAKRSADPRIRREVVGQMLDYAANAIVYWPVDRIRSLAAAEYGGVEKVQDKIRDLLQVPDDTEVTTQIETFWRKVESKLRGGEVRLLFVADELPRELRRVIEFLNEHMPRIEVLGIEVRHFGDGSVRALVPRVIGQTERARQDKLPSGRKTTQQEFLEVCPVWSRAFYDDLFNQAKGEGFQISWGAKGFSVRVAKGDGELVSLVYGYPPGTWGQEAPSVELYLKQLMPFVESSSISRALKEVAPFQESGQYTIKILLDSQNLLAAREALKYIWALGRKIKALP